MPIQVAGFARRSTTHRYPVQGVPLLSTFYLKFEDREHGVGGIQALPDPSRDEVKVSFYDDDGNHEFFYNVASYDVAGDVAILRQISGAARGGENRLLTKPGPNFEFVLVGFYVYYQGADHHIDVLEIVENDGILTINFNDQDNNDTFIYTVTYAWVQRSALREVGHALGRRLKNGKDLRIPRGSCVIRGFRFDFEEYFTPGKDHELFWIGVLTSSSPTGFIPDGVLRVVYADKSGDDGFDCDVYWGILEQQQVLSPSSAGQDSEILESRISEVLSELNRRIVDTEQELGEAENLE